MGGYPRSPTSKSGFVTSPKDERYSLLSKTLLGSLIILLRNSALSNETNEAQRYHEMVRITNGHPEEQNALPAL